MFTRERSVSTQSIFLLKEKCRGKYPNSGPMALHSLCCKSCEGLCHLRSCPGCREHVRSCCPACGATVITATVRTGDGSASRQAGAHRVPCPPPCLGLCQTRVSRERGPPQAVPVYLTRLASVLLCTRPKSIGDPNLLVSGHKCSP